MRTCWCADTDDCKKNKRKWKERKGNLLNTNLGKQICVACECGCVACGHVGEDTDGCKKKRKEDRKERKGKKKRKENLPNTNPGAQMCERIRCMCVQMRMDADGMDADGGGGE